MFVWLDVWVTSMVSPSVEMKPGRHQPKEYTNMYGRMVQGPMRKLIRNVRKLVEHWFRENSTVEEHGQSSIVGRKSVLGI